MLPCFFFDEKGKENHQKNKDFISLLSRKISGKEGENAQIKKEISYQRKKTEIRRPHSTYKKVVQGKCPLQFLQFNGVVCSNTLFSNTSALTNSLSFRANSTCKVLEHLVCYAHKTPPPKVKLRSLTLNSLKVLQGFP